MEYEIRSRIMKLKNFWEKTRYRYSIEKNELTRVVIDWHNKDALNWKQEGKRPLGEEKMGGRTKWEFPSTRGC